MLDPVASILMALSGALLFGSAAVHKLRSRDAFAAALGEYHIVPRSMVALSGALLVVLELAVAAALVWPGTRAVGSAAGSALLLVYAGAIAVNLLRGRNDLDCGCGIQPRTIGGWMVIRNVLIAGMLAFLQLPPSSRTLGNGDFVTIAGGLLVAALLYASLEMLLGRAPPRQLFSVERS